MQPSASTQPPSRSVGADPARLADREWRLRLFEARLGFERDLLTAVVGFATTAIRSLFLLNGGAVIAILAFYGDVLAGGGSLPAGLRPAGLVAALAFFVAGLVAAFGCAAAAYLGQMAFAESGRRRLAHWLRVLALLAAAGSVGCFALGAYRALGLLG